MARLWGNEGPNTLTGGSENDLIAGRGGNDVLSGRDGNDLVYGEDGHDTIDGGAGNDWMHGGRGNDLVRGGAGNDFVDGRSGNDLIYGGAGNDGLFGLFGTDTIHGGTGSDRVSGESGTDYLFGGAGQDEFGIYVLEIDFLQPGSPEISFPGKEIIMDFNKGEDAIHVDFYDPDSNETIHVNFGAFDSNRDGRLTGADDGISIRNMTLEGDTMRSTVIDLEAAIGGSFRDGDEIIVFGITGLRSDDFINL
jgi:Ca2+-binding RTX toxin-like protein